MHDTLSCALNLQLLFTPTYVAPSLFVLLTDNGKVVAQLKVYVDDSLVAANDNDRASQIVSTISNLWEVRDFGEPLSL